MVNIYWLWTVAMRLQKKTLAGRLIAMNIFPFLLTIAQKSSIVDCGVRDGETFYHFVQYVAYCNVLYAAHE
jgi:hypothetical protein